MTLRIELCGTSRCGAVITADADLAIGGATGAAAGGADAVAGVAASPVAPPFWAASISARTIRPFGPLPFKALRSMPACAPSAGPAERRRCARRPSRRVRWSPVPRRQVPGRAGAGSAAAGRAAACPDAGRSFCRRWHQTARPAPGRAEQRIGGPRIAWRKGRGRRHRFAGVHQHGDRRVDLDPLGAVLDQDPAQHAFIDRLDLHGRLVGLDLGDHVARLDRFAFLFQPAGQRALGHRRAQRRHQDIGRHRASPRQTIFFTASTTHSGCGSASFSRLAA